MGRMRWVVVAALVVATSVTLGPAAPARAQDVGDGWIALSGDIVPNGDVLQGPRVTADGQWAVFTGDLAADEVVELWRAPLSGGPRVRLTPPPVVGGNVVSFALTADGSRVVYLADTETDEVFEVWSVPVAGGPAVRLGPPAVAGGDAGAFSLLRDSSAALVWGDVEQDSVQELWLAPIAGGPAVQVSPSSPPDGDVANWGVTADSSRILVLGDLATDEVRELWSVDVASLAATKLNPVLVAGGDVWSFAPTPDGSRAVFVADAAVDGTHEMWSAPIAGGPAVRVHDPLTPGHSVDPAFSPVVSPDSSRVVIRGDLEIDGASELFSGLVAGGPAAKLNPPIVAGGTIYTFAFTDGGTRVAVVGDLAVDERPQIWTVPATGGTPVALTPATAEPSGIGQILASPDSTQILFQQSTLASSQSRMFRVSSQSGPPSLVVDSPAFGEGAAIPYRWSAPHDVIVFLSQTDAGATLQLSAVAASGGPIVPLGPPTLAGAATDEETLTPDGLSVTFRGDVRTPGLVEAFVATLPAPPDAQNDSATMAPGTQTDLAVTANDLGELGVPAVIEPPAHGTAQALPTGAIRYQPEPGFVGVDHVRYQVCSVELPSLCDVANVTITVIPDGTSQFVPLTPSRVFDTRPGEPAPGPEGIVPPGGSIDVQIAGVGGVPAGATAVAMNVTVTDATGAGFVTVWPARTPRPLASTHNLTSAGQTRPNLVVVPLGTDGRVSLYSQAGAHLLGDVVGYFEPAGATAAGRVVPLTPARVFDTRPGEPSPGPKGIVPAGGTIDVQVTGTAGVPDGAVAAVLNVTATEAAGAGFVTVWPAGTPRPLASTLNLPGPGATAANLVMVPLGPGGRISLYSQAGAHLLADVTGWVTGADAPVTTSGLFVPTDPIRVFDTRPSEPGAGPKGFVAAGQMITTTGGAPSWAAAVVINLTATDAATGFVSTFPSGQGLPLTSTVNLTGPADTRPNAALVPLGHGGNLDHYVQAGAHLLADLTGYTLA